MKKYRTASVVILMFTLVVFVFYLLKINKEKNDLKRENEIFKKDILKEKLALEKDFEIVIEDLNNSQEKNISIKKDFRGVSDRLKLIRNQLKVSKEKVSLLKAKLIKSEGDNLEFLQILRSDLEVLTVKNNLLFKSLDSIKVLNDSLMVVIAVTKSELNSEKLESKKLAFKLLEATKVQISDVSVFGIEEKKTGKVKVTSRYKNVNGIELVYSVLNNKALKNTETDIFYVVKNSDNLIVKSTGEFLCAGVLKKFTDGTRLILNGETMAINHVISLKDIVLAKGAYVVEFYSEDGLLAKESFYLKNSFLGVF